MVVNVPAEDAGVRGIVFGDPCTEPGFVGCIHFNSSSMKLRLPRLVNSLADTGQMAAAIAECLSPSDYRVILGDNFYDAAGNITANFFSALSLQAQSQVQLTVPGI